MIVVESRDVMTGVQLAVALVIDAMIDHNYACTLNHYVDLPDQMSCRSM